MMLGRCHCGAIEVSTPRAPAEVTQCRCSICRRYGALWAYYRVDEVSFTGPTQVYAFGRKRIDYHRCADCGCVMVWLPRGGHPQCAVNARMLDGFDPEAVIVNVEQDASL